LPLPPLFADVLPEEDFEGWTTSDMASELRDTDEGTLFGVLDEELGLGDDDLGLELEIEVAELEESFGFCGPGSATYGRRAATQKARRAMNNKGSASEIFQAGYEQALKDNNLPTSTPKSLYGSIWSDIASGMAKGVVGDDFTIEGAARKFTEGIASGDTEGWRVTKWLRGASDGASVELDEESLPPTYVADPEGLDAELAEATDIQESELLQAEETFGACAKYGFLAPKRRERATEATKKAAVEAAQRLRAASFGLAQPFIEDSESAPVLFSDGTIWDVAYGKLQAVPCPSCARAGGAGGCMACDDHGAILVPDGDVESYVALDRGRMIRFGNGSTEGLFTASGVPAIRALVPQQIWSAKVS
jgi:hypothetical protein